MKESSDESIMSCTSSSDDDSEVVSKNSVDSSSSESINEQGEDEMSEVSEDGGIALNRERRDIKPNLMDDHIYFFKKPATTEPAESRKELLAKRIAK